MSAKDKPAPDVIVWRGIRFELVQREHRWALYSTKSELPWTLRHMTGIVDCWDVRDCDLELGEGGTAEEALEAARSQIESIARAVGLIPDVEEEKLVAAINQKTLAAAAYEQIADIILRTGAEFVPDGSEETLRSARAFSKSLGNGILEVAAKIRSERDQLAAKLGVEL